MDHIDKIARLLTEDPYVFNEIARLDHDEDYLPRKIHAMKLFIGSAISGINSYVATRLSPSKDEEGRAILLKDAYGNLDKVWGLMLELQQYKPKEMAALLEFLDQVKNEWMEEGNYKMAIRGLQKIVEFVSQMMA